MIFEWDEEKSERCLRDGGFDFAFSARLFGGAHLAYQDDRKDYGEARVRAVGEIDGNNYAVIYTDRNGVRRIISSRPASRQERQQWALFEKR